MRIKNKSVRVSIDKMYQATTSAPIKLQICCRYHVSVLESTKIGCAANKDVDGQKNMISGNITATSLVTFVICFL